MYFVYIIQSSKDKGFYIGCTTDVSRRIAEHNSGKTESLKHRRPLELVYVEQYYSAEQAYRREKQIKAYKGGNAFKVLIQKGGVA